MPDADSELMFTLNRAVTIASRNVQEIRAGSMWRTDEGIEVEGTHV